jgi:hypothetical protein
MENKGFTPCCMYCMLLSVLYLIWRASQGVTFRKWRSARDCSSGNSRLKWGYWAQEQGSQQPQKAKDGSRGYKMDTKTVQEEQRIHDLLHGVISSISDRSCITRSHFLEMTEHEGLFIMKLETQVRVLGARARFPIIIESQRWIHGIQNGYKTCTRGTKDKVRSHCARTHYPWTNHWTYLFPVQGGDLQGT